MPAVIILAFATHLLACRLHPSLCREHEHRVPVAKTTPETMGVHRNHAIDTSTFQTRQVDGDTSGQRSADSGTEAGSKVPSVTLAGADGHRVVGALQVVRPLRVVLGREGHWGHPRFPGEVRFRELRLWCLRFAK